MKLVAGLAAGRRSEEERAQVGRKSDVIAYVKAGLDFFVILWILARLAFGHRDSEVQERSTLEVIILIAVWLWLCNLAVHKERHIKLGGKGIFD